MDIQIDKYPAIYKFTWSKDSFALSTPFSPILWPISSTVTPGITFMLLSLILTRTPCKPSFFPFTINLAKTTAMENILVMRNITR